MGESIRRPHERPTRTKAPSRTLATVLIAVLVTAAGLAGATLTPGRADAATLALALTVTQDGAGPFTPGFTGPGGDTSANNGIVRTNDQVTYGVSVSANDGPAANETFVLRAPTGTTWSALPGGCTGPGSGITGGDGTDPATLTCDLGDLAEGEARSIPAVLTVLPTLANGTSLAVSGTLTADASPTVTANAPAVTVSAAPRYDLSKSAAPAIFAPNTIGPDGTTEGIALTYPITLTWTPPVSGQGVLGLESLTGPITFTDDVSGMAGGTSSTAQLLDAGGSGTACGGNTDQQFSTLPGGTGGGVRNVPDSGTVTCAQAGPGAPVAITFTGTRTALTSADVPTQSVNGQPLATGPVATVISAFIRLWIPNPPAGTTFTATDTFSPVQATSISGASNFGDAGEPLVDNTATRNISSGAPGSVGKVYSRVLPSGQEVGQSGKAGSPYVTPSTLMLSNVNLQDGGTDPYTAATICDVFDNTAQTLTQNPTTGFFAATTGFANDPQVEYAARTWTTPDDAQNATCTDADGPWFTSPADVPGGIAAIGAVRAVGTINGGVNAHLYSYTSIRSVPNGTMVRDFGNVTTGDGDWIHNVGDANQANGGLADFLIVTESIARIAKKVIDPGTTAATTGDRTTTVAAGGTLAYALYPSLTNVTGGADPQTVTVTDTLPPGGTVQPGSASIDPTSVTSATDADGVTRQTLVWSLPGVLPNAPIDPIRYTVQFAATTAAGSAVNTAVVDAPADISRADYRTATRAVTVTNAGGVVVSKAAVAPVVVVGDDPAWTLTFTNTTATPLDGVDLIDVLPYAGDAAGSVVGAGRLGLAGAVPVSSATGEVATYTDAPAASVSLDGGDPSNRAGGATTWCAATAFGADGCPASFAAVTALRIQRSGTVASGATVSYTVTGSGAASVGGDVYANRFGLRAAGLALPVQSNRATVTVVAGSIGDFVWDDRNGNGVQDPGEPGVGGVIVRLQGTDDRGAPILLSTVTSAAGAYAFGDLRPGQYTVTVVAPTGRAWTVPLAGSSRALDSDVNLTGRAGVVLARVLSGPGGTLRGVTLDTTIDAGLAPVPVAPVVTAPPGGSQPTNLIYDGSSFDPLTFGGSGYGSTLAFTGAAFPVGLLVLLAFGSVAAGALARFRLRRRR